MFVFPDERIEDDLEKTLGTRIDSDAGVQVCRGLVEGYGDDVGVTRGSDNASGTQEDAQDAQEYRSCASCASCVPSPSGHPVDYTDTVRVLISTVDLRSLSIWRVMRALR